MLVIFAPQPAAAQQREPDVTLESIVITGTRRPDRTVTESLSPIDVVTSQDLETQGYIEVDDLLRTAVPSYQVGSHPIDDAGTLVRPAKLRGLAPDQTLVLVNGQRRHRSAVINFISDGLTQGVQGPDLSVIPAGALERIEVLRDGAAAQYGSDAIAGVINFILKEDTSGGSVEASFGQTLEADGETKRLKGNFGLPLGTSGFLNVTADYLEQDETIRSVLRNDVAELIAKRNLVGESTAGLDDHTQIWGTPIIHDSLNIFVNSGYEISERVKLYAFGNYAQREVEGGFYFRNPDTRNGVFDTGGGATPRVVGALDETAYLSGACESYRQVPASSSDGAFAVAEDFANLAALAADPACFSHNERYPNGFTPRFGGDVTDYSLALGVKGEFAGGLRYDLSAYYGQNEADFFIFNTVNSALGPDQPSGADFDPGDYIQSETSFQANFAYLFGDMGFLAAPLHVAFGAEWREESFEVEAGDPFSVSAGNAASCRRRMDALAMNGMPERMEPCTTEELLNIQGFTPASNGFSGFSSQVEGEWERYNTSLYLDIETDLLDALSVGVAVRFENYEDFGSATKGKLSARLRLSDSLGLRGTVSTGFRAPTPGQANVSNVSTIFNASLGDLVESGLTPPTDPTARLFGAQPLEPEESVNYSLGVDWSSPYYGLSVTLDGFLIQVDDRLAPSTEFELKREHVDALAQQGVSGVRLGSTLTYYTNSWDTETKGLELVASWSGDIGIPGGDTDFTLAASYIDTELVGFDPSNLSERRRFNIENMLPKARAVLTAHHNLGNWRFMGRVSHWGSWEVLDSGASRPDKYGQEIMVDLEAAYRFGWGVTLVAGGQNIFDAHPDRFARGASDSGQAYHEYSPFGFNGGFWYTRLRYDF